MSATSEVARSRFDTVAPPTALWQGVTDEAARIVDLYDVSFFRGRLVLHGVEPSAAPTLRRVLRPYHHFVKDVITQDRFDDVFELTPHPLRWAECSRIEERCAFFLSPWHIDNAFHLHCDNLLAVFANLRLAGMLEAPRLLYLFDGDAARNKRAVQLWELMAALFEGAVEPVAALRASDGRIGFRRVRWGRGPLLPYLRDIRETPYAGARSAYRAWDLQRVGVAERASPASGAKPRLLYMTRSDARRIVNPELLAEAFAELGHELRLFRDWGNVTARELVSLAHDTDVLVGVHGAALAHMAYLPHGSMVVELLTGSHGGVPVFQHLSPLFGHRHVRVEVPGSSDREGRVISRAVAAGIAQQVMAEWQQRHSPRVITMRSLGSGKWGSEVFRYMFGKCYARRHGLLLQTPAWAGNELVGASDPPVQRNLADIVEKTEHGRDDTIVPHAPPLAEVNFDGFFQYHTSHYLPDREYIRSLFQPHPRLAAHLEPNWSRLRRRGNTAVALHLRRGDYGSRYFYRAPTAWYVELLEQLWPQLDRPFLYVASDDPDAVLGAFTKYNPASAADLGPPLPAHDFYRDFYVLQHSDVLAISNSSFSFAAAMLNSRLQRAYRPHLPSRRLVSFDPWDDKPLQQERVFHVERYPWRPELWKPTPARQRWSAWVRHHARSLLRVTPRGPLWNRP